MTPRRTLQHLVALLTLFEQRPELLASKLLQHDALSQNFLALLDTNKQLAHLAASPLTYDEQKQQLYSIAAIDAFYDQFFQHERDQLTHSTTRAVYTARSKEEALQLQVHAAVAAEDYRLAARISEYIKLVAAAENDSKR